MDAAVGFQRPGCEGLHRRGVRHVELPPLHAHARLVGSLPTNPLGRVLALGGVAGGEHDVEAVEGELAGGLEPYPTVGARDHRHGPRLQAIPPPLVGLVGEGAEEGDLAAALLAPLPRRLLLSRRCSPSPPALPAPRLRGVRWKYVGLFLVGRNNLQPLCMGLSAFRPNFRLIQDCMHDHDLTRRDKSFIG